METEELLNPYTKDILIQVTEHAKKGLQDQIKMFEENSGTMYDMQVKLAQGIYKVLEKMGFCLGVLMADQPTRHHYESLEQIFSKTRSTMQFFENYEYFKNARAGKLNLNLNKKNRVKKPEAEEIKLEKRKSQEIEVDLPHEDLVPEIILIEQPVC